MTDSSRSRPQTILYLAESEELARESAVELEAVSTGPDRSVRPLPTDAVETLRTWAADADCVVFAETPTTPAGATLLEVVEACGPTPLVLATEASYAPAAARSTDGIDGYVRRDTEDAAVHLADEIEWVCHGGEDDVTTPKSEPVAMPGEQAAKNRQGADRLLESLPEMTTRREREPLFELLVEATVEAVEADYCWLSTVHFGEFVPRATTAAVPDDGLERVSDDGVLGEVLRTGETVRIDDFDDDDRLVAPLEDVRSMCCLPVGDFALVHVAAEDRHGFDERDCELLETYCQVAAAALDWLETESRLDSELTRLRREREQLQARRNQLVDERSELSTERDRLAAERDRSRSAFETLPNPAIRYEVVDGTSIVRNVSDAYTDAFDTDRKTVVDAPLEGETVTTGLDTRQAPGLKAVRSGERQQFVNRIETDDGVREFRLTIVPTETRVSDENEREAERDIRRGADDTRVDHEPEGDGVIVYHDVTEKNRRERELAAAEEQLTIVAELLDGDVRQSLNVARGYLELAEETGDPDHFSEVDDAQERVLAFLERLVSVTGGDTTLVETDPISNND
ncbi:GAF domain-containing protein [Natrialbaceae archaeon A-arb3/5]